MLALCGMSAPLFAQSYILVPSDSIVISGFMEDNQTLLIQQKNVSNDTLYFQWELVSESIPAKWEASVCDNSFCYTSIVASGTMTPVAPGDEGKLLLRFTPHVNQGMAIVRYAVWENANPNHRDTLTYILNAATTSDVDIEGNLSDLSAYDSYSMRVFRSNGECVELSERTDETKEYLRHLSPGCYFVRVQTGTRMFTHRIIRY